jgi:hypothetical protein
MGQIEDIQQNIAIGMVKSAERYDWSEITYKFSELAGITLAQSAVTTKSGERIGVDDPEDVDLAFSDLRKVMATEAHGTWYSATAKAVRGGSFDIDFNYDAPPEWNTDIDDELYLADQERYPRPRNELPDWHPAKRMSDQ